MKPNWNLFSLPLLSSECFQRVISVIPDENNVRLITGATFIPETVG